MQNDKLTLGEFQGGRGNTTNPDGLYVASRPDRYGSNAFTWINGILSSFFTGLPLYHNPYEQKAGSWAGYGEDCPFISEVYSDTVFYKTLLNEVVLVDAIPPNTQKAGGLGVGAMGSWEESLFNLFNQSPFKRSILSEYTKKAVTKGWMPKFNGPDSIVIHVRLGDARDARDDSQAYYGDKALIQLILDASKKYPDHSMVLWTDGAEAQDVTRCEQALHNSGVAGKVCFSPYNSPDFPDGWKFGAFPKGGLTQPPNDIDFEIWNLFSADVLISSNSYFSLLAALLHTGLKCYSYSSWLGFETVSFNRQRNLQNNHLFIWN